MSKEKKYVCTTILIFAVATVDSIGSLFGFWSKSGAVGTIVLIVKGLVLLGLILLSFSLKNWVYHRTSNSKYRSIAWLSFGALIVCVGGDIVNANFPKTFYRYEGVVKHDYLADSVLFFGPGYLLLLVTGALVAIENNVNRLMLYVFIMVGGLLGAISVWLMHIPGTGLFVTAMTGGYAALIGAVGLFGFVLIHSFGGVRASYGTWLVGLGFLLAAVADAVIGNFWMYGNGGEGYYPEVRDVNWILYIGSQCLVIYLPYILVSQKVAGVCSCSRKE